MRAERQRGRAEGLLSASAIVGTGFIGRVHLDALRRLGVRIAGVCGSSAVRSRAKAEEWGLNVGYADFADVLRDESVTTVHITSPNYLHFPQALAALEAGKHVICEKPLALSAAEAEELAVRARTAERVAAVCYNVRYYPHVRELRDRVLSGRLGSTYMVTGHYWQDWLLEETDWNWRLLPGEGGRLRAVGDIGSHWFDLATFITGQQVVEVFADLATFVPTRRRPRVARDTFATATDGDPGEDVHVESEDAASVIVKFDGGARGVVNLSQVNAGHKNSVEINVSGSAASATWRGERPDELWLGHRASPNELVMRDPALLGRFAASAAVLPGGHAEGFENTFRAMFADIYSDVDRGRFDADDAQYATFEVGAHEARLVEAVGRSVSEAGWARVG